MTKRRTDVHDSRTFQAPANRRFTDTEVMHIRQQVERGAQSNDLARLYKVDKGVIYRLVRGETYSAPPSVAARKPSDPAPDPHRALYHLEKAKRAEKKQPALEAARAAFEADLAQQRLARKAGRPRGAQQSFGKRKPVDLCDELGEFSGREGA